MSKFLKFALGVDRISEQLGHVAAFGVLAAAMISAGNAFIRYGFDISSNGWLEIQWYLFSVTVMLGAPLVLKLNEHVRVDLVYGWISDRGRLYVDIFGFIVFLLPAMILLTWMTWPFFLDSFLRHEASASPGGLIRWPAKLLLPLGFFLLILQGLSELIKRIEAVK